MFLDTKRRSGKQSVAQLKGMGSSKRVCMADFYSDSDTEEIVGTGNALSIVVEKPSILNAVQSM